jgi:hypothetical protein
MKLSLFMLACATLSSHAFVIPTPTARRFTSAVVYSSDENASSGAVFVPPEDDASDDEDDDTLDKVESLGRGAAKVSYKIKMDKLLLLARQSHQIIDKSLKSKG